MRWRCIRRGVVTDESRSIAPATNSDTAARRRIRRTRIRSAATSGAGGHDAPRRPSGRQLGVDVGRLGAALDHDVGGDEPLAHGRHGQVRLGEEQADVQVRPRLDLEGRLLTVVQERRREPQPTPVLVHHLGGGARAGEEPGVEVRELGDERPTGDDARRAASRPRRGWRRARPPRRSRAGRGRSGGYPTGRRPRGRAALRRRAPARCRAR